MKKSIFKKWWFWVIIVVVLAVIGSSVGDSSKGNAPQKIEQKTESNNVTSNETKVENGKKNSKEESFKVKDVVQLKDFKITVNKVYNVKGDEFSKPDEGKEFMATDITIENTSSEDKAISSMIMFKVVDGDGRQCQYSLLGQTAAKAGQLDGTVAPGRKMTGVYVVEVERDKKGLELEFDSSFVNGNKVVIKLR